MISRFIDDPVYLLILLPAVVLSLSFHEFAHAFTAVRLGDNTPRMTGRYTLNPLAHLDIIGFLCMLLTGFGWAKPVKVNPRNFKKYKKGMAITAIAGPLSNIMLSFVCIFILSFMARFDILYLYAGKASFAGDFTTSLLTVISSIIFQMAYLNLYLAVFNLIPVPPLDGSRIVSYVLPGKISYYYDRYGQYFQYGLFAILLVFMYTDIFNPIAWLADTVFDGFVSFWSLIF